jgi:Ankyrin repeats (3 copies)
MSDIFEAANKGDVTAVKQFLAAGADVNAVNAYGFTALQKAASADRGYDKNIKEENVIEIIQLLIKAGSNLEQLGGGGRTALFLAAEFSSSVERVQALLDAGAQADIYDGGGFHIVINAQNEDVQKLLSEITGEPVPPPEIEIAPIKMNAAQWNAAKLKIDAIFDALSKAGLVTLQDAGTTQEDGFSDCAEQFEAKGGAAAGLHGFCFYSRQDLNRAKRSSQLTLAFWGAPEGAPKDMQRVGKLIVDTFKKQGFTVDWNGSGKMRPTVFLLE